MVCYSKMCKVITWKERIIRMAFSIKNIAPRLFNSSKYETNVARSSNPIGHDVQNTFNTKMKMNVLTADVFGTKSSDSMNTSMISKAKRMCSAMVGSINDAFPTFRKGFESISAFCNRVKSNSISLWNKLNEIEVPNIFDATRSIKAKWDAKNYDKSIHKLAMQPVSDLETMLVNEIGTKAVA